MKNSAIIILFALLAWAAVGCKTQITDKNTAHVDSIVDVLQAAKKAVEGISQKELEVVVPKFDAYYDFFKNEYTDTSNSEFYTHELDEMQRCRKYSKKTLSGLGNWKAEIDKTLHQLATLKHDYANHLMTEEEFMMQYQTEWQAAYLANTNVQKYLGFASMCLRDFDALSHKLDSAKTAFLATHE